MRFYKDVGMPSDGVQHNAAVTKAKRARERIKPSRSTSEKGHITPIRCTQGGTNRKGGVAFSHEFVYNGNGRYKPT